MLLLFDEDSAIFCRLEFDSEEREVLELLLILSLPKSLLKLCYGREEVIE